MVLLYVDACKRSFLEDGITVCGSMYVVMFGGWHYSMWIHVSGHVCRMSLQYVDPCKRSCLDDGITVCGSM